MAVALDIEHCKSSIKHFEAFYSHYYLNIVKHRKALCRSVTLIGGRAGRWRLCRRKRRVGRAGANKAAARGSRDRCVRHCAHRTLEHRNTTPALSLLEARCAPRYPLAQMVVAALGAQIYGEEKTFVVPFKGGS